MRDRIAGSPGRYKLEFEGDLGTQHAVLSLDDNPSVEGTVLNTKNLLSTNVAQTMGLSEEATPSDALSYLDNKVNTLSDDFDVNSASTNAIIQGIQAELSSLPIIKFGTQGVLVSANAVTTFEVTFPEPFPINKVPVIVITPLHNSDSTAQCKLLTKSIQGFTARIQNTGAGTQQINWIAISNPS